MCARCFEGSEGAGVAFERGGQVCLNGPPSTLLGAWILTGARTPVFWIWSLAEGEEAGAEREPDCEVSTKGTRQHLVVMCIGQFMLAASDLLTDMNVFPIGCGLAVAGTGELKRKEDLHF